MTNSHLFEISCDLQQLSSGPLARIRINDFVRGSLFCSFLCIHMRTWVTASSLTLFHRSEGGGFIPRNAEMCQQRQQGRRLDMSMYDCKRIKKCRINICFALIKECIQHICLTSKIHRCLVSNTESETYLHRAPVSLKATT